MRAYTCKINDKIVNPQGFYKSKLKSERCDEPCYDYIEKFSGKLLFFGDDYTYIKGLAECTEHSLKVYDQDGDLVFNGYFSHQNCEFDISYQQVTIEPQTNDKYRIFREKGKTEYNLMKNTTVYTVTNLMYRYILLYNDNDSYDFPFDDTTVISYLGIDENTANTYAVEVSFTKENTNDGWVYIEDDNLYYRTWKTIKGLAITVNGISYPNYYQFLYSHFIKYKLVDFDTPSTDYWTINLFGIFIINGITHMPIIPKTNRNVPTTSYYLTHKRCRKLKETVQWLVSQIGTYTVVSDFLDNETNYVTNQANQLNYLMLLQKSDFLSPTASNYATQEISTFETMMNDLNYLFQVWWFIDSSGNFRLEHISWFSKQSIRDLTGSEYNYWIAHKLKYSVAKEKLPYQERLIIQDAEPDEDTPVYKEPRIDFVGVPIVYSGDCVDKETKKDYSVSKISTDIQGIYEKSTDVSKTGLVLLWVINSGGVLTVGIGRSASGIDNTVNAHLAATNLMYWYWRHNRVKACIINQDLEAQTSNLTVAPYKPQTEFKIPFAKINTINFNDYVKTALGNGFVENSEWDFDTQMLTFNLSYR